MERTHNNIKMSSSDLAFLRKLAEIKRSGQFKMSMEQLRRLNTIKQGQFTTTITEDEEPMPPKFLTDIQDAEVELINVKNYLKLCNIGADTLTDCVTRAT